MNTLPEAATVGMKRNLCLHSVCFIVFAAVKDGLPVRYLCKMKRIARGVELVVTQQATDMVPAHCLQQRQEQLLHLWRCAGPLKVFSFNAFATARLLRCSSSSCCIALASHLPAVL
jgi:hypothetical protein